MKKKWLYGIILVLAVAIAGIGSYLIFFTQYKRERFKPYVSTFHLLFEDRSHNPLGNLTGEIRITETEKEIIHSICKLSLSSPRPDEYHKPYIDKIELFTAWTFTIYSGGFGIPMPPPPPQNVTLHVGENIVLFEHSQNVSDFEEEPKCVLGFTSGGTLEHPEWGYLILPTIRFYFSDGQNWEWEHEYGVTPPFQLWSGYKNMSLNELSGKTETTTITLTTVEKVNPPLKE